MAFVRVSRSSVAIGANIIGSYTLFLRKDDDTPKARIVPLGHRDSDRHNIRSDSPCVNLEIFCLILSLAAENRWIIGQMDIRTEFIQARGFKRILYVIPKKDENDPEGLWKLLAAAYGLVDSGRLWYCSCEHALIDDNGLTKYNYEHTLYYRRKNDGALSFVLVAQVENCVYAGEES